MKRLALEKNDERLMASANNAIEKGREEGEAWRSRLQELAESYNVREEK